MYSLRLRLRENNLFSINVRLRLSKMKTICLKTNTKSDK